MMHVCPNCGTIADRLEIEFHFTTQEVRVGDRTCQLSPKQLDIIEHLIDCYPKPVYMADLFDAVYGVEASQNLATLQVTLHNLRERLRKSRINLDIAMITTTGEGNRYLLTNRLAA
jgi:DNA-binding winged helix-turn-helix (wHTH) protein